MDEGNNNGNVRLKKWIILIVEWYYFKIFKYRRGKKKLRYNMIVLWFIVDI